MNVPFNAAALIAPLVDFIVGKVIEASTNGDPAKILGRAQDVLAINNALIMIDQGNTAGTAALAASFNTTALSPGEGLALQSLMAIIGNQVALLNAVAGSTLLGGATGAIVVSILTAGSATAQAYITKYGSAAPAPAAA